MSASVCMEMEMSVAGRRLITRIEPREVQQAQKKDGSSSVRLKWTVQLHACIHTLNPLKPRMLFVMALNVDAKVQWY